MAVNATLKAIVGLLKQDNRELKIAAIRVLGAIDSREPSIHKALGEILPQSEDPAIIAAVFAAIETNPHEQMLRFLIEALERHGEYEDRILNAIAKIGGKAVIALKQQFDRVASASQHQLVRVLPRIRTAQAHAFWAECCFSTDHELIRQAVHALREEIDRYDAKEKQDLFTRLVAALPDRRLRGNEASLSALIISLGILAELKAKKSLLEYLGPEHSEQIRRHALMSLARLEYVGDKHGDVIGAILPLLGEADYEGLVRHAVAVLMRIKPRREDGERLKALLKSSHPGVVAYALRALGQIDNKTNAEQVLDFLSRPEVAIRDAAAETLRLMPSAVHAILKRLDSVPDPNRASELVKILESHANRIKPDKAREMAQRMFELHAQGDEHYQLYRTALRHLRADVLLAEVRSRAEKAHQRKDFAGVRDGLKLLDHTELLDSELLFQLTIAKLKTSRKDRSRSSRQSDYCLEHISTLLHEDPKGFKRRFLAERCLDDEDFLYVGFHFSERLNQERRFGADILRYVIKKWPRRQTAQVARQKLQVEGH